MRRKTMTSTTKGELLAEWPYDREIRSMVPKWEPQPGLWEQALCPVRGKLPGGAFLNILEWRDIKGLGRP